MEGHRSFFTLYIAPASGHPAIMTKSTSTVTKAREPDPVFIQPTFSENALKIIEQATGLRWPAARAAVPKEKVVVAAKDDQ